MTVLTYLHTLLVQLVLTLESGTVCQPVYGYVLSTQRGANRVHVCHLIREDQGRIYALID